MLQDIGPKHHEFGMNWLLQLDTRSTSTIIRWTRLRRYSSVQIRVDYAAASDAIEHGVEKLNPPRSHERNERRQQLGAHARTFRLGPIQPLQVVLAAMHHEPCALVCRLEACCFHRLLFASQSKMNVAIRNYEHRAVTPSWLSNFHKPALTLPCAMAV